MVMTKTIKLNTKQDKDKSNKEIHNIIKKLKHKKFFKKTIKE